MLTHETFSSISTPFLPVMIAMPSGETSVDDYYVQQSSSRKNHDGLCDICLLNDKFITQAIKNCFTLYLTRSSCFVLGSLKLKVVMDKAALPKWALGLNCCSWVVKMDLIIVRGKEIFPIEYYAYIALGSPIIFSVFANNWLKLGYYLHVSLLTYIHALSCWSIFCRGIWNQLGIFRSLRFR